MAGNPDQKIELMKPAKIERDKVTRTMFIDFKDTTNKIDTVEGPLKGQILFRIDSVEGQVVGITILKYRKTLLKLALIGIGSFAMFKIHTISNAFKKWFIDIPRQRQLSSQHL